MLGNVSYPLLALATSLRVCVMAHGPHCVSGLDEIIGILRLPPRLHVETFPKFTEMVPVRSHVRPKHFSFRLTSWQNRECSSSWSATRVKI